MSVYQKLKVILSVCDRSQQPSNNFILGDLPREQGQLLKGVQEGTSFEMERDESSFIAAGVIVSSEVDEVEPSYEEACSRSDWPKWKKAIDVELQNLNEAKTWEVVERPVGVNVVDSKWVFWLKKDAEGKILKWKAHLVARGFTQVYGVDYFETFTPVTRLASIHLIYAMAV